MEIKSLVIKIGDAEIVLTPEQLKELNEKLCGRPAETEPKRPTVADAYPHMPRCA